MVGLVLVAVATGCVGVIGGDSEQSAAGGSKLRNAGDGLGCDTLGAEDLYAIGILKNGCVATLVGPNTIVTAAHCLAPKEDSGIGEKPSDGLHWMLNPDASPLPGSPTFHVHRPELCSPEEAYEVARFVSFGMLSSDLALAQILPRIAGGTATYPTVTPMSLRATDPPHASSTQIDLYGRGCTSFGGAYDSLLRRVRLPYTEAGSWVGDFNQRVFLVPELTELLAPHFPPHGDGMTSKEMIAFFENVGNTCAGDSGSPAVVTGTRDVIKVVSGGGSSFDYWEEGVVPRLSEDFGSVETVHARLVAGGVPNGIHHIHERLAAGAAPGNLEALQTTLESVLASGAFGSTTDGGQLTSEDFSPSGCCKPGVNNLCLIGVNVSGCWMTGPGGYCDPNGDGSFDDADWNRGYAEYQAECGGSAPNDPPPPPTNPPAPDASSCCAAGKDNFCLIGVNVPGCAMTQPGGYCDPNGDASFDDADWVKGWEEFQATCP